jgi:hypothetical protein
MRSAHGGDWTKIGPEYGAQALEIGDTIVTILVEIG